MKKRIGSLLLVVAMCLTLLPIAAFAVDDEETAAAPEKFVITSVGDLQAFADAVNKGDYDGKTDAVVTLDADLDLAGIAWIPMGDTSHDFAGTFDGQGHTISNLTIGTADAPITGELAGLFGVVEGTVKNLFLDEVSVNANVGYYVGGLVAYAVGPIENCHITKLDMDAVASGVGGLIGYATSGNSIYGCSVSGEIAVKSGCQGVGGFIGSMGKNAQITYSGATVSVTAPKERSTNAGGFIGCSATSFLRNWDSILEKKRANLRSISEPARLRQPPPQKHGSGTRKRAGSKHTGGATNSRPSRAFCPLVG